MTRITQHLNEPNDRIEVRGLQYRIEWADAPLIRRGKERTFVVLHDEHRIIISKGIPAPLHGIALTAAAEFCEETLPA